MHDIAQTYLKGNRWQLDAESIHLKCIIFKNGIRVENGTTKSISFWKVLFLNHIGWYFFVNICSMIYCTRAIQAYKGSSVNFVLRRFLGQTIQQKLYTGHMRRCLTSSARYRYMMKSLTDTWHRARTIALVELKSSMPRVSSFRLDNPIDLEIFISLFYRYESWEFHVDCGGISNLRIYIGKK